MTQVGEGQEAGDSTPPVMTFGAPSAGEVLAERYELTEHVNDDSAGRMVWRGVDVVLRRPVAVVLRYPGGDSAAGMLQAAVAASRVIHPNLVGVYDAIDEGERAYVVREWVDGTSLRELVAESGPFDAARATSVAHAVAAALSAVHATGTVHGNVHPGTVLIADDGRVVLVDARPDGADDPAYDVRAVGGLLYFALTGHWPHDETASAIDAEPVRRSVPDAVRDPSRAIAAPRQVRAGVPTYLDNLTMDLLDAKLEVPASDLLAAELARLDAAAEEHYFEQPGPLRFTSGDDSADVTSTGRRRVAAGLAALVAVGLAVLLIGVTSLTGDDHDGDSPVAAGATDQATSTAPEATSPSRQPRELTLSAEQVRVIDPDSTKRDELDGVAAVVDGDLNEGWETHSYRGQAKFGGLKSGMGILIDLNEARQVTSVQVHLSDPGASAELLAGSTDAPSTSAGDKLIRSTYTTRIGEPYERYNGSTLSFSDFLPDKKYRYLLLWITELPRQDDSGKYKIGVQEIVVQVP